MTRIYGSVKVVLRRNHERGSMHAGGSLTFDVWLAQPGRPARWVGWVGDGREWRGSRYGGRRWWSCWRQDGDQHARWHSDLTCATRQAAVDALVAQVQPDAAEEVPRP